MGFYDLKFVNRSRTILIKNVGWRKALRLFIILTNFRILDQKQGLILGKISQICVDFPCTSKLVEFR